MTLDNEWLLAFQDCDETPPEHLTLERAHRLMQLHAHHPGSPCKQRRAALDVLIDYGHYRLDWRSRA